MVIQRYEELFTQGRMDALDAIEQIQDRLKAAMEEHLADILS